MIAVGRKIVGHFRHSALATGALTKRQEQMKIPVKKLQQDVATRWNSTLFMLQSLLNSRWPISAVLSDSRVTDPKYRYLDLQAAQWELAEKLVAVLEPLQVATTYLSCEFNVSLSSVLPVLAGLVQSLSLSDSGEDSSDISQFKTKVSSEIIRRWSLEEIDHTSLLVISCALDPRFKHLNFLDCGDRKTIRDVLLSKMGDVIVEVSADDGDGQFDEPPTKKHESALDILLGPEDHNTDDTAGSTLSEEINFFLAAKTAPRDVNPLSWWEVNRYNYPHIAKLAKAAFCIPATSIPAERIFSKSGLIVSDLRSSLKVDTVNALVFLNKNLAQL